MKKISITIEKTDGKWNLSIVENEEEVLTWFGIDNLHQIGEPIKTALVNLQIKDVTEQWEKNSIRRPWKSEINNVEDCHIGESTAGRNY